ncbi:MAG: MarR family winged helix-turn-helix transcriptional regulator [Acidobacteriota bacterium]
MKHALPNLPCTCATLRRAARATSQLYEEALRPSGLRISQFSLLQALSLAGELTQGTLGEILAMDSTTLTRALAILLREGWVTRHRGADRREWRLNLSPQGAHKLQTATPFWEAAQNQLKQALGEDHQRDLNRISNYVTDKITQKPTD